MSAASVPRNIWDCQKCGAVWTDYSIGPATFDGDEVTDICPDGHRWICRVPDDGIVEHDLSVQDWEWEQEQ